MVALCLGAIELVSMVVLAGFAPDGEPPRRERLAENQKWLDRFLAGSQRWNLLDSPLTMPDARVLFRVRPNLSPAEAMGMTRINEYGFRGASPDAPGAGKRIMILGDSCAFGAGIPLYEDTFADRLDAALADWTVINLGQPGHSLEQQLVLFRDWEAKIAPDAVVVYSGWNDAAPAMVSDQWLLSAIAVNRSAPVTLLHRSHFFRLVQGLALTLRQAAGYRRVPPQRAAEILEEIQNRVAARGARVIWVDPIFSRERMEANYGRGQDGGLAKWWAEVEPLLARESMPSFEILTREQVLEGRDVAGAVQADGFHPNETGAAYIAAGLTAMFSDRAR